LGVNIGFMARHGQQGLVRQLSVDRRNDCVVYSLH